MTGRTGLNKKIKITPVDYVIIPLIIAGILYTVYRVKTGMHYNWDWSAIPQYLFRYDSETEKWLPNLLMEGLFNTIRLSIWGILFATALGFIMGLFRVSKSLFKRLISGTYVELLRNTPPLVVIFIFYFFFSSQLIPVLSIEDYISSAGESTRHILAFMFGKPSMIPAFISAVITLAIFEGAYITEIVRSGIESIEKGQWEAGQSLGLGRFQQLRYIILPQATGRIIPPLAGQFISTIKDSAIVSVISIQELTFQGRELMSSTYLTYEIWITVALMYLILSASLSFLTGRLDNYMRKNSG